jgi:hypothetical protein
MDNSSYPFNLDARNRCRSAWTDARHRHAAHGANIAEISKPDPQLPHASSPLRQQHFSSWR